MAKLSTKQRQEIKEQLRIKRELEKAENKKQEQLSDNKQQPSLQDIKNMVSEQKKVEAQSNPTPTQKEQLRKIKKNIRKAPKKEDSKKVSWNIGPGDLVEVPKRYSGVDQVLYGIVTKLSEDTRSGVGRGSSSFSRNSSQVQILTTGGFKWFLTKSVRKLEKCVTV